MRALVFVLLLLVAACHRPSAPRETSTTETTAAVSPGPSIYPLAVSLRDFDDRTVGLDVFRGHPVVVSMFYGTCPAACPLLVSHIKEIERSLPANARDDVRILLVSFDADRDTPARLRELAEAHRVDVARWRFASARDDDARQLANVLGIEYAKGEGGFFSHNSVITVLDREGRVVARTDDPSADLAPLSRAITGVR